MPFDPNQNIFAQTLAQMTPDQAQLAAQGTAPNGVPASLLPNDQYQMAKMNPRGLIPMQQAQQAAAADDSKDVDAEKAKGIQKYLQATSRPSISTPSSPAPSVNPADAAMADYQRAAQDSIKSQGAGLDQMQNYIDALRAKPKGGIDSIDWTPLAALSDAMSGGKTNLASAAKSLAPTSQEDQEKYITGLQGQLLDKRAALSKENLSALAEKLQMDQTGQRFQETMRHNRAEESAQANKANGMGGRVEVMRDNQNQQAAAMFDKDPLIMKAAAQRNQIGIDSHTLNNPNAIINGQVADEISAGIATALSGGKSASLGATEMQRIKSAETDWAKMRQYIENKPVSALSPENRQQLQSILARLDEGYGNVAAARAEQLRKGRNFSYNPDANKVMDNKVDEYKHAPSSIVQAPSGPKPGDIEDGHRYKGGDPSNASNWEALR